MKFLAILLICATVCYGHEDKCQGAYLKDMFDQCAKEHKVKESDITDLIDHKPAGNDAAKCFRACLFQKCQYVGADGKLNEDVPTRLAHLLNGNDQSKIPLIEKAAKKCFATPTTKNVCNDVSAYIECITAECADCDMKFTNVFD